MNDDTDDWEFLSLGEALDDVVLALAEPVDRRPLMLVEESNGCGGVWLNALPLSRRLPPAPRVWRPRKGPGPVRWRSRGLPGLPG